MKTLHKKFDALTPGPKLGIIGAAIILPIVIFPWWGTLACYGYLAWSRSKHHSNKRLN